MKAYETVVRPPWTLRPGPVRVWDGDDGTGARAGAGAEAEGTARRGEAPPRESEPARVVLTGEAAARVRQAAARAGVPPAALVLWAVQAAAGRPSRAALRRYRALRDRLAGAGIDEAVLAELDEVVRLAWSTRRRRG